MPGPRQVTVGADMIENDVAMLMNMSSLMSG